jgi:hypothetical protein
VKSEGTPVATIVAPLDAGTAERDGGGPPHVAVWKSQKISAVRASRCELRQWFAVRK